MRASSARRPRVLARRLLRALSAVTGRVKSRCVDCGGKGICEHKRIKRQCKVRACGGHPLYASGDRGCVYRALRAADREWESPGYRGTHSVTRTQTHTPCDTTPYSTPCTE